MTTAVGLAEQYFELVYLDVAGDEETSTHLLAKAVAILDKAGEREPDHAGIAVLQLRYALRQRNVGRADAALQRARELRVDEQVLLPHAAELSFQQRDWTGLREVLGVFIERRFVNPKIEALAEFWRVERSLG